MGRWLFWWTVCTILWLSRYTPECSGFATFDTSRRIVYRPWPHRQRHETLNLLLRFTGSISSSLGREDGDNIENTEDEYNNNLTSDILEATSGMPLSPMEMTVNDVASENMDYVDDNNALLRQERSLYHVMLVDDEEAIRLAVGSFLEEAGYQVTTLEDAEDALQLLWQDDYNDQGDDGQSNNQLADHRGRRSNIDVIISDVRMPDRLDGLEFVSRLRSHARTVALPVILLTAKGQVQDRIQGYNAGADVYLPKPFDPEELVTIVDNLVSRQEQLLLLDKKKQATLNKATGVNQGLYDDDQTSEMAVAIGELERELGEIKRLLLEQGGGGPSVAGFVRATNVFLAPDEQQVLEWICQGKRTREMAELSFQSTRRVEQLITRMLRKAQVSNRTELVRWAIATGHVRL